MSTMYNDLSDPETAHRYFRHCQSILHALNELDKGVFTVHETVNCRYVVKIDGEPRSRNLALEHLAPWLTGALCVLEDPNAETMIR